MSDPLTREVLLSMMRENHGGGWPGATPLGVLNKTRDLEAEPPAEMKHYGGGQWSVQVSTFHWLANFLQYDHRVDAVFQAWKTRRGDHVHGQHAMKAFFAWYDRRRSDLKLDFDGVHYTYNWENCLSQDFQYAYVRCKLGTWLLLQTHNGVDARDGLANIKVFKLRNEEDFNGYNSVVVACKGDHRWYSDDGYHFRDDDGLELQRTADRESDGKRRRRGRLWMDEQEVFYCPLCRGKTPLYGYAAYV